MPKPLRLVPEPLLRVLVPIIAGAAATIPFQNGAPGVLGLVCLVPFLLLLHTERSSPSGSFRVGYWFGVGFFAALLYWIALLVDSEIPIRGLTGIGWIVLSLVLGLVYALAALFSCLLRRLLPAPVTLALSWVALDYGRSLGALGFPWGSIGYVLADYPTLIQGARIGGVALISFAVVLTNTLVAESMLALLGKRYRAVLGYLAAAILVVAVLGVDGVTTIRNGVSESPRSMRIAVVQPNILAEEKWTPAFKTKAIDILTELTREAATSGEEPLDLAVWPETSVPVYVRQEYSYYRRLSEFVREIEISLLFGFPNAEYDKDRGDYVYYNAGLLLAPDGSEAGEYRKMHLVPFGERLPLEDRFEWIANLDLGQANFTPGKEAKVLGTAGAGYLGTTICFEAIFPAVCRPFVLNGAEYLVNLTNDAWFGMTAAPSQHADMARYRAVELGVPFARAANTGISFICDPFGRILSHVPLGQSGVAVATISPARRTTFYRTHGDWFPRSVLVGTMLLGALGAWRGRKL